MKRFREHKEDLQSVLIFNEKLCIHSRNAQQDQKKQTVIMMTEYFQMRNIVDMKVSIQVYYASDSEE